MIQFIVNQDTSSKKGYFKIEKIEDNGRPYPVQYDCEDREEALRIAHQLADREEGQTWVA